MAVDGSLIFNTKVDTKGFKTGANTIKSQASGLKSSLLGIGKAIGAAFAVGKVIEFGKQAVKTASDLQEVQNVVDTAFGDMAYKMEDFAKNSIEAFGMSKLTAKQAGSTFMAMGVGMGIAQSSASDMAIALTGLTGDMSSFYNVSQDVASTALKSIFTGETETLKQFGIVMTEANLQQYALSQGITKSISAMSQAEKVQLRYSFVMAQTALAQGDFARTSDSWANQTRVLSERWKEFLGILGAGLIQILTPVVKFLNGVMSQLISFATTAGKVLSSLFNIKTASKSAAGAVSNMGSAVSDVATGANNAGTSVGNLGKATKKAAKEAKKSTAGFDELNVLSSNIADSAGDASDALGGLGGGGGNYGMNVTPTVQKPDTKEFDSGMSELGKRIKSLAVEVGNSFMKGFNSSIGKLNFKEIMGHLNGIKQSLIGIFGDAKVQSAAKNWLMSVSYAMGQAAGSMASIGLTVAEFFVGSIDKYLQQNSDYIKNKIIELFDLHGKMALIIGSWTQLFAELFTVFRSDDAKQVGADIIAIFTTAFFELLTIAYKFGNDVMNAIKTPIEENKDEIKNALANSIGIISVIVGTVKDVVNNTFESIQKSYDKYVSPALQKIGSGFSIIFNSLLNAYNKYFAPVITQISQKLREIANGSLKDLIQNFAELGGKIIDGVATIWKKTIAPFLAWFIDKFVPPLSKAIGIVSTIFLGLVNVVIGIVSGLIKSIGGIIDFLVGVFTLDWKKAWNGIKTFFAGIWSAIKAIISPIGNFFKQKFKEAYNNIINIFKNIGKWFKDRYKNVTDAFKDVGTWFKGKFDGAWKFIKEAFSLKSIKSFFNDVWDVVKAPFESVGTWFKNTFSAAWEKVKEVFSTGGKVFDGIKDGIGEAFKAVVNTLIRGINAVISVPFKVINGALNTIRNISIPVAGKVFNGLPTIDAPQIPQLATGTVVPANYGNFLAILGDNKREAEVVSPLSTMKQALKETMQEFGGGGDIHLTVNLDGQPVYQTVVKYNKQNTRRTGKNALA
ncbi:phage tail protein [Anaerosacchariphilus polymeriproducens]|uniref:Uncharacterized protein n=1 Tax=Anaerosacchariphilus polymeriproducens TaxID=1812858 RepID=A0A371AQY3_9FIRM|nr:hypothetical protein [Anaerosacchariphilus polymeriproducens]RDU21942.1 hypothetical protein DWV06_15505 [Anaerosacchariphilus polymeriproducens]